MQICLKIPTLSSIWLQYWLFNLVNTYEMTQMIPSGVPWLISDKEQISGKEQISFFSNSYETNIIQVVFGSP